MQPVSLVVITRNAQTHLARCVQSVPFADDIVVVDSGSDDGTVNLAKSLGVRVFEEPWRGFGPQKQRATELARHDWVLNLDADEALSSELQEEIKAYLAQPHHHALSIPRMSFHLGRWIKHGGWYPDPQVRLYDRRQAKWSSAKIHEKVEATVIGRLKSPIHHWVFKDLSDQVQTNNRYSTLGAEKLQAQGRGFSLFHLCTKPWVKFLECYVWKRGFLDGLPGFIIAVGAAYSVFLKWAKLWELERRKS